MRPIEQNQPVVWTVPLKWWPFLAGWSALLGFAFYVGIRSMVHDWNVEASYSYGYMIPFITAFLIWQKRDVLERIESRGSWVGIVVISVGLVLLLVGGLSTIATIIQYAMLTVIIGSAIAVLGWRLVKSIFMPLLFLVFMIPLPYFLLANLSSQLQLISSALGVDLARLFGVVVFLSGNVIDLGTMKLQVVQACSGLRYLFPLMSLSFIAAYLMRGAFWKRAVVFLSSIPITVLMNSFRIGVISVLVDYWGRSQAEGFLHYFEGWVIFMACLAIIVGEIWVLGRIGGRKVALQDMLGLEFPAARPADAVVRERRLPSQFWVMAGLLLLAAGSSLLIGTRSEVHPERESFSRFPMTIGQWQGTRSALGQQYIDILRFDDYLLADYTRGGNDPIDLYIAYYATQTAGVSMHSPDACIPGGGWRVTQKSTYAVQGVRTAGAPLRVNRLVINKGGNRELVYYWFQERGRDITNEYMAKWWMFWDALRENRTDGALVRLVTNIPPGGDTTKADMRLTDFAKEVVPLLSAYIPGSSGFPVGERQNGQKRTPIPGQ